MASASADKRVCKTTDIEGNVIELRPGDTVFEIFAHVADRAHIYRGVKSDAGIKQRTILAITPKGDKMAFDTIMGRPYYSEYVFPKKYALSFEQAQRALKACVSEIVEGTRGELQRAEALLQSLGDVTPESPQIVLSHDLSTAEASAA